MRRMVAVLPRGRRHPSRSFPDATAGSQVNSHATVTGAPVASASRQAVPELGVMDSKSTRWTAVLAAVIWFVFFVALIFRPSLVKDYPLLAVVALAGCGWWMVKAHRTRRREKRDLLDSKDRG